MGNPFNPYDCTTVNYSNSGCNSTYTGATVTGYNVPTHRSTIK